MSVPAGGDNPSEAHLPRDVAAVMGRRFEAHPPRSLRDTVWRLAVPIGGVLLGIGFLVWGVDETLSKKLLAFAAAYMLPFGIETAVPLGVALGLNPFALLAIVAWFDSWITLFWIWNLDHLTRVKRIQGLVDRSVVHAEKQFTKRPWLARATLPGLTLFIFLPLYGTGSFSGIVLGKLLGMNPALIWIASMAGTGLRVALLGLGTDLILKSFS